MAYLAVDNDGQEVLFTSCPHYNEEEGAWIAEDGKVVEVESRRVRTGINTDCRDDHPRNGTSDKHGCSEEKGIEKGKNEK